MDVPLRHTMTARATRERKAAPAALEAARCALVGNSFACSVVAYIFAHWAVQQGYLTAVPSVEEMRRRGGDWTGARAALHTDVPDSEAAGKLCLKKVGDEEQQDPSAELVMELIRRADPRGSDVRLDTGDLMRASVGSAGPLTCHAGPGARWPCGSGEVRLTSRPWRPEEPWLPCDGGSEVHGTWRRDSTICWTIKRASQY